ncbi:hypothetical protein IAQ61_007763 [Plenodomus lingam]|uniref:uncharacterized protein n=1 Tax=Leptosphaeria maculans TaxID=5022 RepID=UPI00332CD249|nr:hypothetical protein IAQ61_007763 [Plenodomus lingam]
MTASFDDWNRPFFSVIPYSSPHLHASLPFVFSPILLPRLATATQRPRKKQHRTPPPPALPSSRRRPVPRERLFLVLLALRTPVPPRLPPIQPGLVQPTSGELSLARTPPVSPCSQASRSTLHAVCPFGCQP